MKFVVTIFLLCCCGLALAGKKAPLQLEFGVYPSDRAKVMYRKFSPILEALRRPLENLLQREVNIHMTIFEDYESGIKALATGEVEFVRFGPSSYILAEEIDPNIQLLAMELRNGLKRFNGLIVARNDANVNNLNDLRDKTFAFGDANSTIGSFLSRSLLVDNDIHANTLRSFDFLGRHDLVAKALMTGTHQAGALKASTYKKLCDPEEVTIVHAFSNVTKPWIASSELSIEICEAITAALLIIDDKDVIGELGCSGFAEATPEEYDLVRIGMKNAKAFDPKPEIEDSEN